MNVYVARFSWPRSIEDLATMVYDVHDGDGTDLEDLLAGTDCGWTMPRSCFSGDIVLFQLGARSDADLRRLQREAENSADENLRRVLRRNAPLVSCCSGSLVAVGKIGGRPFESDLDVVHHFRGRVFAPVCDIVPFQYPVKVVGGAPLMQYGTFAAAGPVTHRMFDSETAWDATRAALTAAGNRLPRWMNRQLVSSGSGEWWERARQRDAGFFSEDHLKLHFAYPLAAALADDNKVRSEVRIVRPRYKRVGTVDYVIHVDGEPIPLEVKLNVTAEHDFLGQIAKYTGPATLGRAERLRHGVVVAVDRAGVYILDRGNWTGPPFEPNLARTRLGPTSVARLRRTISKALDHA